MPPHARPGVSAARAANAGGINGDRKEEVSYQKSSRARKKIENPWTSFLHAANDNAAIKVWRGVCVYRDMYLCARFLRMQKRIFSTALCTSLSRPPARPPPAFPLAVIARALLLIVLDISLSLLFRTKRVDGQKLVQCSEFNGKFLHH
jgi:hypothetical protein